MARPRRRTVSQKIGSYHIISRVAGGGKLFRDEDKEEFIKLLEHLAPAFFVQIHAFCIMSSHFHILATCMEQEAAKASKEELLRRYHLLYPKSPGPPEGTYDSSGVLIHPDGDGGIERLRKRLGTISRFVQELKQTYSREFNKRHDRKGYLWSDRFKGLIVSKGDAQINCSAYIDLNPVRANIVKEPEDYQWSSLGLRVRTSPIGIGLGVEERLLYPFGLLPLSELDDVEAADPNKSFLGPLILSKDSYDHYSNYREFVYLTANLNKNGRSLTWPEYQTEVAKYHSLLGVSDSFGKRVKNFSEGIAFGNYAIIASFQKELKRKRIRPRSFMKRSKDCSWSFSTRVLRE